MCYYRLFIFLGCGHSTFSSMPVRYCTSAQSKATTGPKRKSPGLTGRSSGHSASSSNESNVYSLPEHANTSTSSSVSDASQTRGNLAGSRHELKSDEEVVTEEDEQPCAEGPVHPFHTVKLERLCAVCDNEREERLRALDSSISEIRFEPWRWQCKYQGIKRGSLDGKDDKAKHGEQDRMTSGVWGMGTVVEDWWKRKDSGISE